LGEQGLSKTGTACAEKDKLLKPGSELPFRRLTPATAGAGKTPANGPPNSYLWCCLKQAS